VDEAEQSCVMRAKAEFVLLLVLALVALGGVASALF
jgi:hypothetical protein